MDKKLDSLLAEITNYDDNIRSSAILALEALLVKANFKSSEGYEIHLPIELNTWILSIEEQVRIGLYLLSILETSHEHRSSLFWLLGKIRVEIALPVWFASMIKISSSIDDNTLYEALIAFENYLYNENTYKASEHEKVLLDTILRKAQSANNEKSREVASAIIQKIKMYGWGNVKRCVSGVPIYTSFYSYTGINIYTGISLENISAL